MASLDALHADLALRGAVAGLLLAQALNLAWPGPKPAARLALLLFVVGTLAYVFCQQAELLLHLPRAVAYGLLACSVAGTAWMWVAAWALFDDSFRWTWPLAVLLGAMVALGLAANVPYFPDGEGPYRHFTADSPVAWLGRVHTTLLMAFAVAALWEVLRGWRADLVQARRVARRWVALGIGLYAALALAVELALRGEPVGRLLPALHVAGIGSIALALSALVARRSLSGILDVVTVPEPGPRPFLVPPEPTAPPSPPAPPARPADAPMDRAARLLARLDAAMTAERVYRREGLKLADLAQLLGVGEAPLRELINQRLGFRNFNDFLHHHRLAEATQRLVSEDLPILSIALDCGYGSIGPFNRAFKQRWGMTPTEYRAAKRLPRDSA